MIKKPIYVTRPELPPVEELTPFLEQIWHSRILTNNGPFHMRLEQALCEFLDIEHLALFTNGTIALVTALQALRISGEVITTPFSFVATAHSLLWNNIKPVFVDIDPNTCNIDPNRIEEAITPETTAIMPVHCYGNPCDVERIEEIADNYGLKVIYDAAHAFGVRHKSESLLRHGDLAVLSFHATKVFNTFEGGAIVCPDAKTKKRIDHLKNFGFVDEVTVATFGINGKMNELNAAIGLLQLKYIEEAIARRRAIDIGYREALKNVRGIIVPRHPTDTVSNHSYFPIMIGPEFPITRDALYERLREENVYARRYFFPLISQFPMYRGMSSARPENLPAATRISEQVLCLPIYPALTKDEQAEIIRLIMDIAHE